MKDMITYFKKVFLTIICSILVNSGFTQILDPVRWTFEVREAGDGQFDLVMKARIEDHWHLYTQEVPEGDASPLPTVFTFEKMDGIDFVGKVKESKSITAFEPVLGMEISFFAEKAEFSQRVRNNDGKAREVKGSVEYMTCDDKKCLPPEIVEFSFSIPAVRVKTEVQEKEVVSAQVDDVNGILEPVKWSFEIEKGEGDNFKLVISGEIEKKWHVYARQLENADGPIPTSIEIEENSSIELIGDVKDYGILKSEYDGNFMMNLSFFEESVKFIQEFRLKSNGTKLRGSVTFMACDNDKCIPPEKVDFELMVGMKDDVPMSDEGQEVSGASSFSFWSTFTKGFLGGLLALLTPCVFPMIPLTVSFFTKQSKTKAKGVSNALLYGASIIAIYVLLGYGVTTLFGADALNALSTNVWFNLVFFVLLVVFAISFFGAFEITLPSSWVNKADSAADKGGLIGIFFMAFTLSLVSFSCTGPIIGTLLVDAAVNGGVQGPLVGMFAFSIALALPFGLFAAFPGWLNSLPSSGGWLNSVKVVLGFLELALALKFLSNADLVVQAGLLKRELFIAIWIAIFSLMTAYLLGFYSLPHDSKNERISVTRLLFATVSLMFTIYLIPGIWGAPLKLISGFPPPMFYSESPNGLGGTGIASTGSDMPRVGEPEHCPHSLNCFHDYDEGLAYARQAGRPVMLDFTGWACVNCRKMEEQVWSDPSVLRLLREEFVLISLYVDEKILLPAEEQVEVKIGSKTKKLKTVGNKWSYLQARRYNTNSQPYYVILDHDENVLNGSAAYDPDIEKFRIWLEQGISRFKQIGLATSQ